MESPFNDRASVVRPAARRPGDGPLSRQYRARWSGRSPPLAPLFEGRSGSDAGSVHLLLLPLCLWGRASDVFLGWCWTSVVLKLVRRKPPSLLRDVGRDGRPRGRRCLVAAWWRGERAGEETLPFDAAFGDAVDPAL